MAFSNKYLERCWKSRGMWKAKRTYPGDWYLTGDSLELHLVSEADAESMDFHSDTIAFVPDIDDLLELIDNRIRADGRDPATKRLTIRYDPEVRWSLEIEYGERRTRAVGQESAHSLLLYALHQLAMPRL